METGGKTRQLAPEEDSLSARERSHAHARAVTASDTLRSRAATLTMCSDDLQLFLPVLF
jgi:hypothetical protein